MEQLSGKVFDFLAKIPKSYYLPILLSVAGMICLGIGLIQLLNSHTTNPSPQVLGVQKVAVPTIANMFGIKVDVEGAVQNPGVYTLSQNARVEDGLIAAGGLSVAADRGVVAKSINLAAKLIDGTKIYIPHVGDVPQSQGAQALGAQGLQQGSMQSGLVNINTASATDLDNLPGIGPVTAQKIIAARPFSSIDDLTTRKVISQSVFAKIKDKITAN